MKECLKHNEELRGILDKLRLEQARSLPDSSIDGAHVLGSSASTAEMVSLKVGSLFYAWHICSPMFSMHVVRYIESDVLFQINC